MQAERKRQEAIRLKYEKADAAKKRKAEKNAQAKTAREAKAKEMREYRDKVAAARKSPAKPRKAAARQQATEQDTETDEDEEYQPSPKKKQRNKGKSTPGIPVKGVGAKRVAVPGVSLEEVFGPESEPEEDPLAPPSSTPDVEPEKEKRSNVYIMIVTFETLASFFSRHLLVFTLDIYLLFN